MCTINESLEIRKLPLNDISQLTRILDVDDAWKKLMANIPKTLQKDSFICDIDTNNLPKYRTEHFHLIENGAEKYHKSQTAILLDEWGTSGRIRPTVGHLKYLLEKTELYRAADYVATNILKQGTPARPAKGPSAPVIIQADEDPDKKIEKILDELDYPSSAIENINKMASLNVNINYSDKLKIPDIVISELEESKETAPVFNVPLVTPKSKEVSDMMKFSSESDNNAVATSESQSQISESVAGIVPEFDLLKSVSESTSQQQSSEDYIPVLSQLNQESVSSSEIIPNISTLLTNSQPIPHLSDLMDQSSDKIMTPSSRISRSASSPLPNLTLNTNLPHFSYVDLQKSTDNFNMKHINDGGRLLGAGAFGKVFLAVDIIERPVAVKQLFLENTEKVEIEDYVTVQFRNEVEILSQYKHENLVSLLGYSCDGDTYCLLYDYIPGGALKDRLQNLQNKLIWTDRVYIAYGTARAISYLHTAFDQPLIHRDVKSANILLDYSNKPKLCDFGLVKLAPTVNTIQSSKVYGTNAYMSPEAQRGDISVKLDTFSFGVVLLELLTSLPPIDEKRNGVDLVTHIEETCDEDIEALLKILDSSAGSWKTNDINIGQKLFEIALLCLKPKKLRPNMVDITTNLTELIEKCGAQ